MTEDTRIYILRTGFTWLVCLLIAIGLTWLMSMTYGKIERDFGNTEPKMTDMTNTEDLYSADIIFKDGTLGNKDRPLTARAWYITNAESVICTNCKNVRIIFDSTRTELEYNYVEYDTGMIGAEIEWVIQ